MSITPSSESEDFIPRREENKKFVPPPAAKQPAKKATPPPVTKQPPKEATPSISSEEDYYDEFDLSDSPEDKKSP